MTSSSKQECAQPNISEERVQPNQTRSKGSSLRNLHQVGLIFFTVYRFIVWQMFRLDTQEQYMSSSGPLYCTYSLNLTMQIWFCCNTNHRHCSFVLHWPCTSVKLVLRGKEKSYAFLITLIALGWVCLINSCFNIFLVAIHPEMLAFRWGLVQILMIMPR